MKIEKINERQIRCTLTQSDLEDRHIKLSELVYGSEKARGLFRDMLSQAMKQYGFDTSNRPLMIEAVPSSGGQLTLIITKVEDPEELDARFARYSHDKGAASGAVSDIPNLTGADEVLKLLKSLDDKLDEEDDASDAAAVHAGEEDEDTDEGEETVSKGIAQLLGDILKGASGAPGKASNANALNPVKQASGSTQSVRPGQNLPGFTGPGQSPNTMTEEEIYQYTRFYLFRNLDSVMDAAGRISSDYTAQNTLYKNPDDGAYYLLVRKQDTAPELFNQICNVLSEYAMPMDYATGMDEFFREHMTKLLDDHAIQGLKQL